MDAPDRRRLPREALAIKIQVLPDKDNFESPEDSADFIPAKIVNQSDSGLQIEMECYLEPGLNVRVKMAFEKDSGIEDACYIRYGRVVWCDKASGDIARFGAGIKILRKVIQGRIPISRFRKNAR